MGCRSDYMEPDARERELLLVNRVNHELNTGNWPDDDLSHEMFGSYGTGDLDAETRKACKTFKARNIKNIKSMSLEAQIWWRDHQAADQKREAEEKQEKKDKALKAKVLAKLSADERRVLGH